MTNFSKKTLALAVSVLALGGEVNAAAFDLNLWSEKGPPNNGNWVVGGGGTFVDQTINGNPTFFVSPDSLIDRTFSGSFQVLPGGNSDDDYIGIVFGYQSPTGNTSSDTNQDFLSFAWKQGAQSGDPAGMFLSRVNGTNVMAFGNYDIDTNRAGHTTVANNLTHGGWLDNTAYDFTLNYRTDRITIDIQSATDTDFTTAQTVFDISLTDFNTALTGNSEPTLTEFPSGNFGFFNHSQEDVRYSGIAQDADPIADAGGPYTFDASNLTISLDGTGSFDPDGGSITSYNWTTEGGGNPTGATPSLGIVDSGLTSTTDTASVRLDVVDDESTADPDGDTAAIAYSNTAPALINIDATRLADGSVTFSFTVDDDDLGVNALIAAFESVDVELDMVAALTGTDVGDGFMTGNTVLDGTGFSVTYSVGDLLAVYGSEGSKTFFANAVDNAGDVFSGSGDFLLQRAGGTGPTNPPVTGVPVPAGAALFAIGLAGLGFARRRKH